MIQKTKFEKEAAKNAKKAFKQRQRKDKELLPDFPLEPIPIKIEVKDYILTGIMEGENILEDDYPVYYGYTYVIDDNGGIVVVSNVQGTIKDLRKDIQSHSPFKAINIYNCKRSKRNMR